MDADSQPEPVPTIRSTRRRFIGIAGAAGASAAAVVATPDIARAVGRGGAGDRERRGGRGGRPDSGRGPTPDGPDGQNRFSRLFARNETGRNQREEQREALIELSRPGGLLDANDPLEVGPVRLITEPELSPDNPDNPGHTAGTTFVGQFLDHDITRDVGSTLGRPTSLRRSTNLRSPRFDLDSVYAGGPADSPDLYGADGARFLVESGGQFEDLARDGDGAAIIGDPRNDENLIISGLHAAVLLFHNAVMDRVETSQGPGSNAFAEAQRQVRWHYQWMIMHEFLPQIVGPAMVNDVVTNGRRFYTPDQAQIPVEFQTAAYRFGHSMVRPSYRANLTGQAGEPFFALVFDPAEFGKPDPEDLTGGHRASRRFIDWQTFFDFDDGEVKPNKRIDCSISTPLFRLPASAIGSDHGEDIGPTSLATRNLLRHLTWEVATGQDVAAAMGEPALTQADLASFGQFGADLDAATPLWLYVFREAELAADGLHLGPVGGRIVAEVFIGLLQMDATSYLGAEPGWRPTLPTRAGDDDFGMVDLLTVAGVDPDSRAA